MKLKPRWYGPVYPEISDFLASDRPIFAYMVQSIRVVRPFKSKADPAILELDVLKIAAKHLPDGATIWPFKWDSRGPKKDRHTPAL